MITNAEIRRTLAVYEELKPHRRPDGTILAGHNAETWEIMGKLDKTPVLPEAVLVIHADLDHMAKRGEIKFEGEIKPPKEEPAPRNINIMAQIPHQ